MLPPASGLRYVGWGVRLYRQPARQGVTYSHRRECSRKTAVSRAMNRAAVFGPPAFLLAQIGLHILTPSSGSEWPPACMINKTPGSMHFRPEESGSIFLQDYSGVKPRRPQSEQSQPWKFQNLYTRTCQGCAGLSSIFWNLFWLQNGKSNFHVAIQCISYTDKLHIKNVVFWPPLWKPQILQSYICILKKKIMYDSILHCAVWLAVVPWLWMTALQVFN